MSEQRDERFLQPFAVIRHAGDPREAVTHHGERVRRQDELWVPEWGCAVKCTPYDNHFIYETKEPGQSAYMCTCGSPAGVVPPGPNGLFVCLFHAEHGRHTTAEVNVRDFKELAAGQVLRLDG